MQVGVERDLLGGVLEPLLAEPLAPDDRPRAGWQQPPVAQTELREPVAVAHPIEPRVLAGPDEIAGRLELRRGHVDRLQQPAGMKPGKLARIARICLDPITGPLRHQPRRDHRAVDPALGQIAVEAEAGWTRLVAAAHRRPAAQQPLDRLLVIGQRPLLRQLVGAHRRQPDVALPGAPRQPTTNAQAPTTLCRRSDAAARGATAPSCLSEDGSRSGESPLTRPRKGSGADSRWSIRRWHGRRARPRPNGQVHRGDEAAPRSCPSAVSTAVATRRKHRSRTQSGTRLRRSRHSRWRSPSRPDRPRGGSRPR